MNTEARGKDCNRAHPTQPAFLPIFQAALLPVCCSDQFLTFSCTNSTGM